MNTASLFSLHKVIKGMNEAVYDLKVVLSPGNYLASPSFKPRPAL